MTDTIECWPGTETPRDQPIWPGIGYSSTADWGRLKTDAKVAASCSAIIKTKRAAGEDTSSFVRGISRKSEEINRKQLPPAAMKVKGGGA